MNPLKCAFGVSAGNFLGFLVHKRGIEVDQNKVKAIINARAPANKKQVQRFLGQTNVIKYMLSRPLITGRIGKWALALMEFNFIYVPQKSVKGRVLANFLADHPSTDIDPWVYDELESSAIFLTPWILMFDGSSTADGAGADFKCSNNQAEYEALIIGLEIFIEMAVRDFWPRGQNKEANSMAQAASGIRVPVGIENQLIKITRRSLPSAELRNTMLFDTWTTDVEDLADDDWRIQFIMFLRNPNIKADRSIKRKAINFVLLDGDLYRKGLEDGLLL
ncbi:uncharacterized protein LOC132309436 [Cornus florida]|uniref:uncharacterized protein LOC132309436 n=1 Tax=Cornus florida TaxID=4283 RepID=UPI00289B525B|nr:uncharacterized protein LOC132309436 [Cornus florida]